MARYVPSLADSTDLRPFLLLDGYAYGLVTDGIGHGHTATNCP